MPGAWSAYPPMARRIPSTATWRFILAWLIMPIGSALISSLGRLFHGPELALGGLPLGSAVFWSPPLGSGYTMRNTGGYTRRTGETTSTTCGYGRKVWDGPGSIEKFIHISIAQRVRAGCISGTVTPQEATVFFTISPLIPFSSRSEFILGELMRLGFEDNA